MNSFTNIIIMDELSGTDNPFSDIYENAHDIFRSHDLPSPFNRTPSLLPIISSFNTPYSRQLQDLTSLPPEGTFYSEEVVDILHKWALEHRFAFVKQHSQTKNKAGHKVTL
jgi:hypothetical protein